MRQRPVARPRVLIDTNIVLDVALARQPWVEAGSELLDLVSRQRIDGFVAAHAVTTVHYLIERARGRAVARTAIADLLTIVDVVPVGRADFLRALSTETRDFEDAVHVAAALSVGAHWIATRDARDYRNAPVPCRTAAELVALLATP
ncbi:MAG: PIN domain-containing protein [Gemmatimonadaceae bacterium]|jgi:predicted nucleic acid-binding protein|nr:PIN domain-containing protein [Gemmatimonadaceae bacterium]